MRNRRAIEETFVGESRYGSLNCVGSCRPAVASATAHFSSLAYALPKLFARKDKIEEKPRRPTLPNAGVELVAYWGPNYATIHTSRLIQIVAEHSAGWGAKLRQMLQELRAIEQPPYRY